MTSKSVALSPLKKSKKKLNESRSVHSMSPKRAQSAASASPANSNSQVNTLDLKRKILEENEKRKKREQQVEARKVSKHN